MKRSKKEGHQSAVVFIRYKAVVFLLKKNAVFLIRDGAASSSGVRRRSTVPS